MSDNIEDMINSPDPSPLAKPSEEELEGIALVEGKPFTKLPDNLFIPPDALRVFLESFEGPLDLLLYLIRRQNLDILNIPIAAITKQYTEYVELMRTVDLDLAAEYLVMSAMLAEIKSRMLLPRPHAEDEEDGEDPRIALVRRLQEYERFREAGERIEDMPRMGREWYLAQAEFDSSSVPMPDPNVDVEMLARAFREIIVRQGLQQSHVVEHEGITVREQMTFILAKLDERPYWRFDEILDPSFGRTGIAVSFIALLELTREDLIIITQNEPFAPIHIQPKVH